MRRFYCDVPLKLEQTIALPEDIYHHWLTVLRARVGETAILFDGQGGEYIAKLIEADKKSAKARLVSFNSVDRAPARKITIGQVLSKGDRMDYMIQKATELGATAIQLLTSERCEERLKYQRDQKKIGHWQNIAISACEQCGLNQIPQILQPKSIEEWVKEASADCKLVMAPTEGNAKPDLTAKSYAVLIGPEGGLTEEEIKIALEAGFLRWQLGERVLRTETASIVALTLLQAPEWL